MTTILQLHPSSPGQSLKGRDIVVCVVCECFRWSSGHTSGRGSGGGIVSWPVVVICEMMCGRVSWHQVAVTEAGVVAALDGNVGL